MTLGATPRQRRIGSVAGRVFTHGGAPLIATLILIYSRVLSTVTEGTAPPVIDWGLDVLMCTAAALSGVLLVPSGVVVGLAFSAWILLPSHIPPFGVIVFCVPILSAAALGHRKAAAVFSGWYLVVAAIVIARPSDTLREAITAMALLGLLAGLAWLVGTMLHNQLTAMDDLKLAHQEAVREERREIARDLHDAVASAMARMIMRAEEALLKGVDDPEAAAALENVVTVGREGNRDLRAMLVSLRDDTEDANPATGLWNIHSLAEVVLDRVGQLRAAGFSVDESVDIDESTMPTAIRNTLGKVVVEATSNIMKHARPGSRCGVLVEADAEVAELVLINVIGKRPRREGLGLIGLRERLLAFGGELETSEASGTFVLRARLTY